VLPARIGPRVAVSAIAGRYPAPIHLLAPRSRPIVINLQIEHAAVEMRADPDVPPDELGAMAWRMAFSTIG
jgi:hypothetical protein